ncbi:MAG: Holliday junction DNA helicase RuvA [Parcubacteria bacterium C7867-007]|nr:MAG: Holliday junction DNA helicase RuvA [Parcubacteria bacterium C7867-007]
MIRELSGVVIGNEPGGAIVEVAGFGIFVHLAAADMLAPGDQVRLKTYMAFKQDGVDLYGFSTEEDRRFFEQLLTVSGVGPKTALSIFSRASRESLETAIASRDLSYLTRVVGLGNKAAEKLVVELSEKVTPTDAKHDDEDAEVFDTLVALGYTDREARTALSAVPMHIVGRDARLKAALAGKSR